MAQIVSMRWPSSMENSLWSRWMLVVYPMLPWLSTQELAVMWLTASCGNKMKCVSMKSKKKLYPSEVLNRWNSWLFCCDSNCTKRHCRRRVYCYRRKRPSITRKRDIYTTECLVSWWESESSCFVAGRYFRQVLIMFREAEKIEGFSAGYSHWSEC